MIKAVKPEIILDDWPGGNSSYLGTDKNLLRVALEWKQIDYVYPSEHEKKIAIDKGSYIPGRPFLTDMDVSYRLGL